MARVNVDILGIRELKWTGMGKFYSDDHYIYYCGEESLRKNGVAMMVNKRVRNAVLGCNLKNDQMTIISISLYLYLYQMTIISTTAGRNPSEEMEWPSWSTRESEMSTWMQSQKQQNDLCSFPRQTIQYHRNPSLCPNQ